MASQWHEHFRRDKFKPHHQSRQFLRPSCVFRHGQQPVWFHRQFQRHAHRAHAAVPHATAARRNQRGRQPRVFFRRSHRHNAVQLPMVFQRRTARRQRTFLRLDQQCVEHSFDFKGRCRIVLAGGDEQLRFGHEHRDVAGRDCAGRARQRGFRQRHAVVENWSRCHRSGRGGFLEFLQRGHWRTDKSSAGQRCAHACQRQRRRRGVRGAQRTGIPIRCMAIICISAACLATSR